MISSVTQVAYSELLAGEFIEEHLHDSMEEVFLVLDGICEFCLDGVPQVLIKDSVIKIAPKINKTPKIPQNTIIGVGSSAIIGPGQY